MPPIGLESPHILIIDDEKGMCHSLEQWLQSKGFRVSTAFSAREGLRILDRNYISLILCDIVMPDMSGLLLMEKLDTRIPTIIMTAYSSIETARRAFKLGACDYLVKPFDLEELLVVINQHITPHEDPARGAGADNATLRFFGSKNPQFLLTRDLADRFCKTDISILIQGESGTGKEVLAEYIHEKSHRAGAPLVRINCAAIPDTLLESELFGYEKGAFTGADRQKRGKFAEAHGGTLFLDEISDMALPLQAKMLRVLQDLAFSPLGSERSISVNVRIIAASNRDLEPMIRESRFRLDLFHRLNGTTLTLPPLRSRTEDIEDMSAGFLAFFCSRYGKKVSRLDTETLDIMKAYPWPGNIRELRNCIERAVVVTDTDTIRPEHLPDKVQRSGLFQEKAADTTALGARVDEFRAEYLRKIILNALKEAKGNRVVAARTLNISRRTLYNRMKDLNIHYDFT